MYFSALLPSELMATSGASPCASVTVRQAPRIAPAAWLRMDLQMLFRPYSPPAHRIIIRSGASRSGGIRCE